MEGGTLQTYHWHVWECSQCLGHAGFAPVYGMCAFLVYTAQALGYFAWELSKADPGLCALPRSKQPRFRFSGTPQRHRLSWVCVLCPSQVRAAQATQMLGEQTLPGLRCILSPPQSRLLGFLSAQQECCLRCAMCLVWEAETLLAMSVVQDPRKTWLATGSLLAIW